VLRPAYVVAQTRLPNCRRALPASLTSLLTDVDGRGTDPGVLLAAADLLVLRDGAALVLVLPPEHSWPSEGDRQEALRRGDRLSLHRLQLVPRANCLNWELHVSYGLPARIVWREPVNRPMSDEAAGPEGAVTEHINALLGDADAPDRWHYRSLSLLTAGEALTGLQLAHHPVCADPQAPAGWRCGEPVGTTYEGIHRLPACWYTSDGSAFGWGTYLTRAWRISTSTTSAARANTRSSSRAQPCR
jgi:hypothetical protein